MGQNREPRLNPGIYHHLIFDKKTKIFKKGRIVSTNGAGQTEETDVEQ